MLNDACLEALHLWVRSAPLSEPNLRFCGGRLPLSSVQTTTFAAAFPGAAVIFHKARYWTFLHVSRLVAFQHRRPGCHSLPIPAFLLTPKLRLFGLQTQSV